MSVPPRRAQSSGLGDAISESPYLSRFVYFYVITHKRFLTTLTLNVSMTCKFTQNKHLVSYHQIKYNYPLITFIPFLGREWCEQGSKVQNGFNVTLDNHKCFQNIVKPQYFEGYLIVKMHPSQKSRQFHFSNYSNVYFGVER